MKCPICNVDLHMTERYGIEIDYCPQCRGIWLDRGELDKIIEKVDSYNRRQNDNPESQWNIRDERYDDDDDNWERRSRRQKMGGFLGDLFDF